MADQFPLAGVRALARLVVRRVLYQLKGFAHDLVTTPVVAGPGALLREEQGSRKTLEGADRIAIIASWSPSPEMSLSLSKYLWELSRCGYVCLVVSSADTASPLRWPHGLPPDAVVLRRENIGYDFGSWAAALNALPEARKAEHVLLTNDSMVGPFTEIASLLREAESSLAGVVALTDSLQMGHAIQSYFMMFNGGILDERPWRSFFQSIRPQPSKMDVVYRYEVKVGQVAVSGGYGWDVIFPAKGMHMEHTNPVLFGWEELLTKGFPFVKRTLWTDPEYHHQAREAERYLRKHHGVEVAEWLPRIESEHGATHTEGDV